MSNNYNFEENYNIYRNSQKARRIILAVMFTVALGIHIFFNVPFPAQIFALIIFWFLLSYLFDYTFFPKGKMKWNNSLYNLIFIFDVLILTGVIHYLGTLEWIGFSFYVFSIIFSNLIFSAQAGLLMTTFIAVCYSGLVFLEYFGWLPHRHLFSDFSLYHQGGYLISTLTGSLAMLYMTSYASGFFANLLRRKNEELKLLHQQLFQSEKISSLGQISANILHEINNPLFTISGETEMLLRAESDSKKKESLEKIFNNTCRVSEITSRLLSFSRKQEPRKELTNINLILEEAISLLGFHIRCSSVELTKDLGVSLPRFYADPVQIQEVFFNIIINALQAMPKGGKLNIKTYLKRIESKDGLKRKFKIGQEVATIEFSDTGTGIPQENLSKIFEPFFSTKENSTGLGLAICYKILQEHNGLIEAESKVGQGSTFSVFLPR